MSSGAGGHPTCAAHFPLKCSPASAAAPFLSHHFPWKQKSLSRNNVGSSRAANSSTNVSHPSAHTVSVLQNVEKLFWLGLKGASWINTLHFHMEYAFSQLEKDFSKHRVERMFISSFKREERNILLNFFF